MNSESVLSKDSILLQEKTFSEIEFNQTLGKP